MRRLWIVLLLAFLASPAWAVTRYVDQTCGDVATYVPATRACTGGSDTSRDTISEGLALTTSVGDVLRIRAGTYVGRATWNTAPTGTSYAGATTVEAYPGEEVLWKAATDDTRVFFVNSGAFIVIRGIIFDGEDGFNDLHVDPNEYSACETPRVKWLVESLPNTRWEGNEFRQSSQNVIVGFGPYEFINNWIHHIGVHPNAAAMYLNGPNMVVRGNLFEDVIHPIASWNSENWVVHNTIIENNIIRRAGYYWAPTSENGTSPQSGPCIEGNRRVQGTYDNGGGIQLYRGQNGIVRNNTIANSAGGIFLGGGVTDCLVFNNTIYGTAASGNDYLAGIMFDDTTGSGAGGPEGVLSQNCEIRNNIIHQPGVTNPAPIVQLAGTGHVFSNNLCSSAVSGKCTSVGNPLFVDQGNGDLRLQAGSPAIDTGFNTTATVPTDILGVTRPQGSAVDIGAYEFVGSAPPEPFGLVAWWMFDENTGTTAADSSGFSQTLTAQDTAAWGAPAVGVSSIELDGLGDYWATTLTTRMKPPIQFSITGWIKPVVGNGEIFSAGDSYGAELFGDVLFCYYYDGSSFPGVESSGVNLLDGAWHHIGCVKTATAVLAYVDGLLRGSAQHTTAISYTLGTEALVGASFTVPGSLDFEGLIDQLRVYDNGISEQGILNDYNDAVPIAGLTSPYTRFYQANVAEGVPLAAIGANITMDRSAKVRMRFAVRNGGTP